VLDAPSNLGLNPPATGVVPGCYKLPWALRNHDFISGLAAFDAGCVVPPRYVADWTPGSGDRNADAIARYSSELAHRIAFLLNRHPKVVVLGGDCSILLGPALALRQRGRFGLVFMDAHSDFRHPGNSSHVGAAAGEDLAIVTGRGDPRLAGMFAPPAGFDARDIHVVGIRPNDDDIPELLTLGMSVTTSHELLQYPPQVVAERVLQSFASQCDGFWIHLDADVIDAGEMPAVDCPEKNGPSLQYVADLLHDLFASSRCLGLDVTIFDPDLDIEGSIAQKFSAALKRALGAGA
jgi:arginase